MKSYISSKTAMMPRLSETLLFANVVSTKIMHRLIYFNNYSCSLLINFANNLDQDQARHSVGPDLDPKFQTVWHSDGIPERIFQKS